MTIYLHPNAISPKRFRVYDKSQKVQKYFSFAELGFDVAQKEAQKLQDTIDKRNKINGLIDDLTINKIFHPNGRIKGLNKSKDGNFLRFQLRIQKYINTSTSVSLKNVYFEDAFNEIKKRILKAHGVENTPELEKLFKAAKRLHW